MLAKWTEILPLILVKWLARKHCMVVEAGRGDSNRIYHLARPDVLIKAMQKDGVE